MLESGLTERLIEPLAPADQHQLVAVAGELLDVLSDLLQQGRGHIRRIPGRRELDHPPILLAQDLYRVDAVRRGIDQLVRDQGDAETALVDVHYSSKKAAS